MGPVACFDKSFIQSLSIDESVWFDHYFVSLITPLFFVETLADLEKQIEGRSPEAEVKRIAEKTPEVSGTPQPFHITLCNGELLGRAVSMTQRPILANAKPAAYAGKQGFVAEVSPEARAWERWRQGSFLDVERLYAKAWREMLLSPTSHASDDFLYRPLKQVDECKNLSDVLRLARSVIDDTHAPYELMKFVFDLVSVPSGRDRIFEMYRRMGFPALRQVAPYTAHVTDVEIFCRLALKKGLISAERPSNRVDVAYLNYLPFCQIFISGDNLHKRTAPLFMSSSQDFIWGPDLKADLKRINELHLGLPQETRERGILAFAAHPPKEGDFLTAKIWDRMTPRWRDPQRTAVDLSKLEPHVRKMVEGLRKSARAGDVTERIDLEKADALVIDRRVSRKKGSWYQVPKDML